MTPRRLLIPLLILSGLLVSACALGQMIKSTSTPTAAAPALQATLPDLSTPDSPSTPTPEPTLTPTEQTPDQSLNLTLNSEILANFRHRLVLKFSGQDASGSATSSKLEVMEEVDKAHEGRHRMARSEIQDQRPGLLDLYQTGQGVFLVSSESSDGPSGCVKTTVANPSGLIDRNPAPADLIESLERGELVGQGEVINSATTDHYHLNGIGISFGKADKSSGDIWIENKTGLIIRIDGWVEGALSLGGGASYGRVEMQYNFNKAAQVQISLPSDCQALADNDLPFPEKAGDPKQSGAELSYQVKAGPALVASFFRIELVKRGWTIDTDAGGGSLFEMDASKDGKNLHITITAQDQGARVIIQRK